MNRQTTFMVASQENAGFPAISSASFAAGEVGLFKTNGTSQGGGAIAVGDWPLFIAQKTAFDAKVQPTIKSYYINSPRDIKAIRVATPVAEVGQITYVGFNGTTGDISYDCETEYSFKMVFNSPWIHKHYGTDAGLTHTVAIVTECCDDCDAGCGTAVCYTETAKFVQKINDTDPATAGYAFSIYNFVGAELMLDNYLNDTVITVTAGGDGVMGVTNGSTTVTFDGSVTIAAGTYLRINPSNAVPTDASPVYKVATGVTAGSTIELDTPWQGATDAGIVYDSGTPGSSEVNVVTLSGVTACGIKLTGKFISNTTGCCCFPPFPWDVEGVTFIVTNSLISSFPCTFDVTYSSDLVMGQGTYNQLLYEEMYALGYSDVREFFKDCALNVTYQSQLTPGETYTVLYIDHVLPVASPVVSSNYETALRTIIAVPTGGGSDLAQIKATITDLLSNAALLPVV